MKRHPIFILLLMGSLIVPVFSQIVEQNSGTTNGLNSMYFIDQNCGYIVGTNGTILKTSDSGNNWEPDNWETSNLYYSVYFQNQNLGWIVGQDNNSANTSGVICRKTHADSIWKRIDYNTLSPILKVQFVNDSIGWIIEYDGTVKKSTDSGNIWSTQYKFNRFGCSLFFINENIGWAISAESVAKTMDGGENWASLDQNLPENSARHLSEVFFIDDSIGWLIGNSEIYKTCDGGETWQDQSIRDLSNQVYFLNSNIGLLTADNSLYLTTNGGDDWESIYSVNGIGALLTDIYILNNSFGWIIGSNGATGGNTLILKIDLTSLTDIEEKDNFRNLPDEFVLSQNYPNPFNPVTTISFFLPEYSKISIKIYDINGKFIKLLLNNSSKSQGFHKIAWDATDLCSGVYFYQMENEQTCLTKKCLLIK